MQSLTGSQQHELCRSAKSTGADESIHDMNPEFLSMDLEEILSLLD